MRRLIVPLIICSLGIAACYSGAEYRWAAFIGCAFYGDTEACDYGPFPLGSVAPALGNPRDATDLDSASRLTVEGLTRALHEQYIAFEAARASALAAGRPVPSPAEFVVVLDGERPVSREEARQFLEDALGPDWIHRIELPTSARASSITEPL